MTFRMLPNAQRTRPGYGDTATGQARAVPCRIANVRQRPVNARARINGHDGGCVS